MLGIIRNEKKETHLIKFMKLLNSYFNLSRPKEVQIVYENKTTENKVEK